MATNDMDLFNLTALKNLGNICYMNTTIQTLFATTEFRKYILDNKSDKKIISSLSSLFKGMIICGESEDTDCFSPHEFWKTFVEFKPQFNNNNHQDSQEFLRLLVDGIHEEVNEAKGRQRPKFKELKSAKDSWIHYNKYIDDSFLVKLFVGQLCSTIKCSECNHKSQCWDTFWDISLSLPEIEKRNKFSVKDCLKAYTSDEVLDNDSMPTCANCKTKKKSIKSLRIEKSPLILTLNLKRFGNNGQKLSQSVSVNPYLILNSMPYILYGCVSHRGESSSGGHYTAYCKYDSGNWYNFDDSTIDKIEIDSNASVIDEFSDAYILFYHMKDVTIKH